ncbi:class I lanthipeptide [Acidobacteriota bacterium]
MKKEKLQKKLVLNKKTITNLHKEEMDSAKGGVGPITTFGIPCPTDYCSQMLGCDTDWTCEWGCIFQKL